MPIPKAITRINRRYLNPVMGKLARRAPMMAVVVHRGRNSGRRYETPVLAFSEGAMVTIALTYGPDVDWLKNVLAAGGCRLIRRGRERQATDPRMLRADVGRQRVPEPVRLILRLLRVGRFVALTEHRDGAEAGS